MVSSNSLTSAQTFFLILSARKQIKEPVYEIAVSLRTISLEIHSAEFSICSNLFDISTNLSTLFSIYLKFFEKTF